MFIRDARPLGHSTHVAVFVLSPGLGFCVVCTGGDEELHVILSDLPRVLPPSIVYTPNMRVPRNVAPQQYQMGRENLRNVSSCHELRTQCYSLLSYVALSLCRCRPTALAHSSKYTLTGNLALSVRLSASAILFRLHTTGPGAQSRN